MKYIPVLYSTPMVLALLEDRKKMTRRTKGLEKVNETPNLWTRSQKFGGMAIGPHVGWKYQFWDDTGRGYFDIKCPYGEPGDVLWVRERVYPRYVKGGYHGFRMQYPNEHPYRYYADDPEQSTNGNGWKPSIHMPKTACRIFLEVTDVCVERLQEISTADAIAEGIEKLNTYVFPIYRNYLPVPPSDGFQHAPSSFKSLWYSINGAESWKSNPWVWVISFKRIDKPADFHQ